MNTPEYDSEALDLFRRVDEVLGLQGDAQIAGIDSDICAAPQVQCTGNVPDTTPLPQSKR